MEADHSDHLAAGHHHGGPPPTLRPGIARWLWVAVGVCGAVTLVAVLLLWPGADGGDVVDPLVLETEVISAEVAVADDVECSYDPTAACRFIAFDMFDGPYEGDIGAMEMGSGGNVIGVGDRIEVTAFEIEPGNVVYSFYDFDRDGSMLWLVGLFVVAVLLLGRWRGVGALAGLAFSLLVLVVFTLPAVLDGSQAVWVALTTASLIAFAALFLAHGFELGTAVALLSTFASLALTALLAWIFVGATNLTGLADESSLLLGGFAEIDPRGILLAGVVIGALGVLDDVTVTQVSAVWEIRRLRPEISMNELVKPALRIGRDHISSTVNTLFLAYAGAALPLLLLFTEAGQGVGNVITREVVATEVVRALVGSIGLVASVPISTWLAAYVVTGSTGSAGSSDATAPEPDVF